MTNHTTKDDARIEKILGRELRVVDDEGIGQAVMSGMWSNMPNPDGTNTIKFEFDGTEFTLGYTGSYYGVGATANNGYGLHFWKEREGKEYEDAIEIHVESWRRKARPFLTGATHATDGIVLEWVQDTILRAGSFSAVEYFIALLNVMKEHHGFSIAHTETYLYLRPGMHARTLCAITKEAGDASSY